MSNHFALSLEAPPENTPVLSPVRTWTLLLLVFAAVHVAALFTPPLLDDADANHATAAQSMAFSGDWVTLKVDGVRYLEKPPLPYWLAAAGYRLFGFNVFATHLPLTLGVLGLAILAWVWGRRAYGDRAAFYAALGILTSAGVFLFTRIFIPEVLLTLLLAFALYNFLIGLEDGKPSRFYLTWAALALAMLAKGLVAPVFFFLAAVPYLLLVCPPAFCCSSPLPGLGTFSLGCAIRAPATLRGISPLPAMFTAFSISTLSTSKCSGFWASVIRWTTTNCPLLSIGACT
jgi:hypothetical protein